MNHLNRLLETTRGLFGISQERRLEVKLAETRKELQAAQRLRKDVFDVEFPGIRNGAAHLDADEYDEFCRHLIVLDHGAKRVVGTYRILDAAAAQRLGAFYSEQEFDLTALAPMRSKMVELGRSCVHPDYRDGTVIRLLWSGLGEVLSKGEEQFVIGCASVSMQDGGHYAAAIYRTLARRYLSDDSLRVIPRHRLPSEVLYANCDPVIPPLIKGYLRVGAKMLGEPHVDLEFGTADFLLMLSVQSISQRYSRKFMKPQRLEEVEGVPA